MGHTHMAVEGDAEHSQGGAVAPDRELGIFDLALRKCQLSQLCAVPLEE
jgi:hypothetical protein